MNVANRLLLSPNDHQFVQPVSCLLIDDDPTFRHVLRTVLTFFGTNPAQTFEVVSEAVTMRQGLQLIQPHQPMLILIGLEPSCHNNAELISELKQVHRQSKVLILSGYQSDEWVFRAMQAGANGYIFKSHMAKHLFKAVEAVMNDEIYLSPEVATGFFRLFRFYSGRSQEAAHKLNLTHREQDVLDWLVQGASNDEIASHLYITVATVKAHLTAIFQKLSVSSRTQAIIKALKLGLSTA